MEQAEPAKRIRRKTPHREARIRRKAPFPRKNPHDRAYSFPAYTARTISGLCKKPEELRPDMRAAYQQMMERFRKMGLEL